MFYLKHDRVNNNGKNQKVVTHLVTHNNTSYFIKHCVENRLVVFVFNHWFGFILPLEKFIIKSRVMSLNYLDC